mmetsp:Transcript_2487/g.5190  ORF Transcript_2487/g.5190 Transcript_2487/m.5190 type:complete len:548 (+) Transcript_2487:161-1804(+)|eukprot:CAMPEP_0118647898 /NCGR_PEP_ID=MMETSP0785-20121206/8858_1 /TAXON_ID=91992 /ORGANISM="Bolidomonas pacifica, Strain CCMP 1866" /LENGTH=547 /DNA_ID=CAMNT_0006540035 /DNA_START=152 /DNA_END=1795 /DNA_ORIENTATION=+
MGRSSAISPEEPAKPSSDTTSNDSTDTKSLEDSGKPVTKKTSSSRLLSGLTHVRDSIKKSFTSSKKRGSVFVTSMRPSFTKKAPVNLEGSEAATSDKFSDGHDRHTDPNSVTSPGSEETGMEKSMSKSDLAQYRLEKTVSTGANGEEIVRMNYVRRNSVYEQGDSILKQTSSPQSQFSARLDTISDKPSQGSSRTYGSNPSSLYSDPAEKEGWREKRKRHLEASSVEASEYSGWRSEHSGWRQNENIEESGMFCSDEKKRAENQRDKQVEEAAHALMKGFSTGALDSQQGGGIERNSSNVPDTDHAMVRIHPELIVIVIENVLNFKNEDDEEGRGVVVEEGYVEEGEQKFIEKEDIWYSKAEIAEFRAQSTQEQYLDDLKTGQNFMQSLAHDANSRKEEEMNKTIASLLSSKHTSWEEKIKSPVKSGKKTWDSRKARTGSMETFFMDEEGFATFEDQSEAKENRTWDVEEAKKKRRRRSGVTINPTPRSGRSRRHTKVNLEDGGEGDENTLAMADSAILDLSGLMDAAKAETVAAILAVEAMDFSDD